MLRFSKFANLVVIEGGDDAGVRVAVPVSGILRISRKTTQKWSRSNFKDFISAEAKEGKSGMNTKIVSLPLITV